MVLSRKLPIICEIEDLFSGKSPRSENTFPPLSQGGRSLTTGLVRLHGQR